MKLFRKGNEKLFKNLHRSISRSATVWQDEDKLILLKYIDKYACSFICILYNQFKTGICKGLSIFM